MNLLLDTHVLLWVALAPERMSSTALAWIADRRNTLWVSSVSVWEIANKSSLGKLTLNAPLQQFMDRQRRALRFFDLALTHAHAMALAGLPRHHKDPADRLLIVQASVEGMRLVTADGNIARYDVGTIW